MNRISLLRRSFLASRKAGQLAHAYLLLGPDSDARDSLARSWAQSLICSKADEEPCGQCPDCAWVASGAHSDFTVLEGSANQSLKVEEVREGVVERLQRRSREGGAKVVLVVGAERLTLSAQDSLLKTLEEPPPDSFLFLTARDQNSLTETLLSRCRLIHLGNTGGSREEPLHPGLLNTLQGRPFFPKGKDLSSRRQETREFLESCVDGIRRHLRHPNGSLVPLEGGSGGGKTSPPCLPPELAETLLEGALQALGDLDRSVTPEMTLEGLYARLSGKMGVASS